MKTYLAHGFHREDSAMHVCMVVQIPDEDFVRVSLASVAESYAPQFCFHWFENIDGAGIPDDFRQKVYTEARTSRWRRAGSEVSHPISWQAEAAEMKIITADQRLAEKRGAKILIAGPSGVGKTSLLRTLDQATLDSTLFVDIEAGDLAVADLKVASVRPRTGTECRDIACAIGGANPALPPTAAYSEAHHREVIANADLAALASCYPVRRLLGRRSTVVVYMVRTAAGSLHRPRQEGSARCLRPARAHNDRLAESVATGARPQRDLRRDPRKSHR
jgi:hypothetical protein